MSENIIEFPKISLKNPINQEKLKEFLEESKSDLISQQNEWIYENIVMMIMQMGLLQFENIDDTNKMMLFEAIGACLSKCYDVEHPFHDLADEIFSEPEENNDTC